MFFLTLQASPSSITAHAEHTHDTLTQPATPGSRRASWDGSRTRTRSLSVTFAAIVHGSLFRRRSLGWCCNKAARQCQPVAVRQWHDSPPPGHRVADPLIPAAHATVHLEQQEIAKTMYLPYLCRSDHSSHHQVVLLNMHAPG